MRPSLWLAVSLGLAACGAEVPGPGEARAPGWYGVPPETASTWFALVSLTLVPPRTLQGELPPGIELAVQWPGEAPQRFSGTFPEPPAPARVQQNGCEHADGLLLAYQGDELVAVSDLPEDRFSPSQQYYNQKLRWSSCATAPVMLQPLFLFHDDRLPLALCGDSCALPLLDRTRIASIDMEASGDGRVTFTPRFVFHPKDLPAVFTVNGRGFTPAVDSAAWHPGANSVRVQLGTLPAWQAEVVLPAAPLAPRVSPLREGSDFTVEWSSGGDWGPSSVTLYAVEPFWKGGQRSFDAARSPLTARYAPWMGPEPVTRVRVQVRQRPRAEPAAYRLTLVDDVEVPSQP